MAIPDTINQAPIYLAEPPDWQKGVTVTLTAKSDVQTAHAGNEQRARWRILPRLGLEYVLSGLTQAQAALRRIRAAYETQALLVAPVWPWGEPVASFSDDSVTTFESFDGKFWQAGMVVLIEYGDIQVYRTVTAIDAGAKTLTFDGAEAPLDFDIEGLLLGLEDDGSLIVTRPTGGDDDTTLLIYPCIPAVRVRGQGLFDEDGQSTNETFRIEQL